MDAIEKAVRNALEKGEAEDNNYRRRVYVSARSALEKSMAGRKLSQDMVDQRFSRLAEVAAMIESEFAPATEDFGYPAPGRRSYEAAAPLVEDAPQPEADSQGSATSLQSSPIDDDAPAHDEPFPEPYVEPETPVEAEPTAFSEHLPEDEPETEWTAPEVDAPVKAATEEAETTQPRKRKPTSRKNARVLTPIITETEPMTPAPDLFEGGQPVWDSVVMPAPETDKPGDELPFELTTPDHTALEPQMQENEAVSQTERPTGMPDLFEEAVLSEEPSIDNELASGDASLGVSSQEPETEPNLELTNAHNDILDAGTVVAGQSLASDDAKALKDADLSSPVLEDEPQFEVRPLPVAEQTASQTQADARARNAQERNEPKRGWAFLFILVTLLAFLVMGLWVAYTTGSLKLRTEAVAPAEDVVSIAPQDEPVPSSSPPAVAASPENEWLMIFRPDNPGDLVVDPTIKADVAGAGPLAHLRIEPAASSGAESVVVFSIGKGILEQIAGKSAVFDIVAAADDNSPTQISVLCDFAGLGDCGRKRYRIDAATSDNLFQIEFPEGKPDGDGQVIINPDVDGKGRSLEIYAIKVRIADK